MNYQIKVDHTTSLFVNNQSEMLNRRRTPEVLCAVGQGGNVLTNNPGLEIGCNL